MAKLTSNRRAAEIIAHLQAATNTPAASAFTPAAVRGTKPHPWQVRWIASAESWCIFLPARAVVGKTADCTALTKGADAPEDWYAVTADDAGNIVLHVLPPPPDTGSDTETAAVKISAAAPTPTEPPALLTVCAAHVTDEADSRGRPVRAVCQYVTSAIPIGGEGGGCDTFVPGCVDLIEESGGLALVQYWDKLTGGQRLAKQENPNGKTEGGLNATAVYAFRLLTASHAADHTDGLLPR